MVVRPTLLLVLVSVLCTAGKGSAFEPISITAIPDADPVEFATHIAPLLQQNCTACHNGNDSQGDVNLESYTAITKSEYDGLVVPGQPDESRLLAVASHADEPVMPPEDNDVAARPLTPKELGYLKAWIQRGAKADSAATAGDAVVWSQLPSSVHPTFATEMTDDGRLTAASFGNRIKVFGAKSDKTLATLEWANGAGEKQPAHKDLVQDLLISNDGRQIVSAGFRNVKIWTLQAPQQLQVPPMETSAVAVNLSADGSHLLSLSADGILHVGEVAKVEWSWTGKTGFDAEKLKSVKALAVSHDGSMAALIAGTELFVHQQETAGAPVEPIALPAPLTDVVIDADGRICVANDARTVTIFTREGDAWTPAPTKLFDTPIEFLEIAANGRSLLAIDAVGNLAWRPAGENEFSVRAKLPTGASQAAIAADDASVWVGLTNSGLVRVDRATAAVSEIASKDPAANAAWEEAQWIASLGERFVSGNDADLALTEANLKGEKDNQAKLKADLEKRKKELPEATKKRDDAKSAAEAANKKLTDAVAAKDQNATQRDELQKAIQELTDKLAQLKLVDESADEAAKVAKSQSTLTKEKTEKEAALKALPAAAPLEKAVADAQKAADTADTELTKQEKAHSDADAALKLSQEAIERSNEYVVKLDADIVKLKAKIESSKTEQAAKAATAAEIQKKRNASKPFAGLIAALPDGGFVTRGSSGDWSAWSSHGDWIAAVSEGGTEESVLAIAGSRVLVQTNDPHLQLMELGAVDWDLERMIGAADDESPFADRVLCLDSHSTKPLLATGGGIPARSGEVHLWNLDTGELVTSIPAAHADTVLTVRFSRDGSLLATAGADRLIKIWSVETGEQVSVLEGHTQHVSALAWSADDRQLTSASADYDIRVWDLHTAKTARKIGLHKAEVTDLAYVGRDARIAVVAGDQTFRVIRTDNGGQEVNVSPAGGYLYSVSANREGTTFAIGGSAGVPKLIEKSGKPIQTYSPE